MIKKNLLCFLTILMALMHSNAGDSKHKAWPKRTVKVIVPFKPGGGSDTLARVLQKSISDNELLPRRLTVLNYASGHLSVGCRKAMYENPDGYTFLLIHRALMGVQATGVVDFGHEDFEPVAETTSFSQVLVVSADSKWQTMAELLADAAAKPGEIIFGCNKGALNHMAGIVIQDIHPGAAFNYVQIGGGSKNYEMIKGGHVAVSVLSSNEYIRFKKAGDVRALAYTDAKRHESFPDVPTLKDLGHDITFTIGSWWFAPKGTPKEAIDGFAAVLKASMQTDYAKEQFTKGALAPTYFTGQPFKDRLAENWVQVQAIAGKMETKAVDEDGLGSYAVPYMILAVLALLGAIIIYYEARSGSESPAETVPIKPEPLMAAVFLAMTCVYLALLAYNVLSFGLLTSFFVFLSMGLLLRFDPKRMIIGLAIGLLIGFGCEYIFTEIFTIDLPTGGAS